MENSSTIHLSVPASPIIHMWICSGSSFFFESHLSHMNEHLQSQPTEQKLNEMANNDSLPYLLPFLFLRLPLRHSVWSNSISHPAEFLMRRVLQLQTTEANCDCKLDGSSFTDLSLSKTPFRLSNSSSVQAKKNRGNSDFKRILRYL